MRIQLCPLQSHPTDAPTSLFRPAKHEADSKQIRDITPEMRSIRQIKESMSRHTKPMATKTFGRFVSIMSCGRTKKFHTCFQSAPQLFRYENPVMNPRQNRERGNGESSDEDSVGESIHVGLVRRIRLSSIRRFQR